MRREGSLENGQITLDDDASGCLDRLAADVLGELPGQAAVADWAGPAADPVVASGSYVVDPPFFGDGDIGRLAVCGSVNDLAAQGAEPVWITLGLTVEAGLPTALLRRVLMSVRDTASEAGVRVHGFDARVVRPGEAQRLFAHTTALGIRRGPLPRPRDTAAGDLLLLTSPLGGWAVHLLSVREGLGLETLVPSGCRPLHSMLRDVVASVRPGAVRQVRRIMRGGLAKVLEAQAVAAGLTVRVAQESLPVQPEVDSAAELLGIDPLHVTDEGCLCLRVAADAADTVRGALRAHPYGLGAAVIGEVTTATEPVALLAERGGRTRRLDARATLWPEPARLR
ncbi:AIR synthase related protein [Streptomyces sp. TRM68367]|uniref:AIR synthase related protein n=1 Tax=Streptomyces sp. TRM68367 TaxID=2758415 RepID=UPI00165AA4F7|nr:AIR synthase related protein [Streptomyces sp. TRM68367]MBC9727079.1 hydrogenase expression/formation protein HypE [Streptomyces sp. TRM68367]